VSLRDGAQKSQSELTAPLIDTAWVLTELANEPVPAGAGEREATIRFMTGGRVAGFSGCNRFSGSYTLEGRLLRFGTLAVTQMACADGPGVEAEYMKALEATRQFQIHRGTLDLLDAVGRNAARFKATLAR
jgi:heat shock protein HslJ